MGQRSSGFRIRGNIMKKTYSRHAAFIGLLQYIAGILAMASVLIVPFIVEVLCA